MLAIVAAVLIGIISSTTRHYRGLSLPTGSRRLRVAALMRQQASRERALGIGLLFHAQQMQVESGFPISSDTSPSRGRGGVVGLAHPPG
jgi:hypothetical protein